MYPKLADQKMAAEKIVITNHWLDYRKFVLKIDDLIDRLLVELVL